MKMKNIMAALLVGAMMVPTTVYGASDAYYNTDGYFPIVNEPITITMSGLCEFGIEFEETHVFKRIASDMGIQIDHTGWDNNEIGTMQFATMITTDTLSDLLFGYAGISKATANQYGAEGYLLDLTDYLDIMPNFAKFLEENPEFAAFNKTEDGSIYSLDRTRKEMEPKHALYVSKADQEKYGFSVSDIKSVEDFYEVLKSIKEQDPEVIPWGWCKEGVGIRGLSVVRSAFGIDTALSHANSKGVDAEGNVILYDITDANKDYYKYMNQLWDEELIDQEAFILTQDEYRSNIQSGKYVFWYDWAELAAGLDAPDGSCYQEYDRLMVLTSDYCEVPTYIMYNPYNTAARCMVSAKTQYPEAICRLLDYMFTEEGYYFYTAGTEGETYEWVDNGLGDMVISSENFWDKEKYQSKDEWMNHEVRPLDILQIVLDYATLEAVHEASDEKLEQYISEDPNYSRTVQAHYEKYIREQAEEVRYASWLPTPLNDEENAEISQPEMDMNTLLEQYNARFISGDLDVDADWDAFVKQISVFWDKLQPVYQASYDRIH